SRKENICSLCELPSGLSLRVEDCVLSEAPQGRDKRAVKEILALTRIAKLGPSRLAGRFKGLIKPCLK
ncbi:MAG: hypothetical protein JRI61_03605, partial [Deltaproteobacteria bacterium]|nr:hypothetical protein [Deltaproteobacteria bacterium]